MYDVGEGVFRVEVGTVPTEYVGYIMIATYRYELRGHVEMDADGRHFRLRVMSAGPTLDEEIEAAPPTEVWSGKASRRRR